MSWAHTLLPASYKDIPFDVVDDSLDLSHALSEHAYPYVAGDDVDDLGIRARRIHLDILVWGDAYERRLQTLLAVLAETGPGELVHPVYGSIPDCVVDQVDVNHTADGVDQCTLSVDFVQSTAAAPFFGRLLPLSLADAIDELAGRALAASYDLVASILGAGDTSALPAAIGKLFAGLSDLTGQAYSGGADIARQPQALLEAMRGATAAIASRFLPDNAAGTQGWRDFVRAQDRLIALPQTLFGRAVRRPLRGGIPASAVAALTGLGATAAAAETASQAADLIAADLDAASPQLTPEDIDLIVGSGRDRISRALAACRCLTAMADFGPASAIGAATLDAVCRRGADPAAALAGAGNLPAAYRDLDAWREMGYTLQQQGRALLELRPPLITRPVPRDMPLLLLAWEWYGDYGRRLELLRLNPSIRHPNFLSRGEVLRAYAA